MELVGYLQTAFMVIGILSFLVGAFCVVKYGAMALQLISRTPERL